MNIIRFAIENPVKVAVGVLLILLFGAIALISIPIQLTPNVDTPIITVTTEWTGRSPEEVEREIIERQEDVLKNISGLRKMTATAYVGRADITLEFYIGTDIKNARQEVSDSLREVPEYPAEVNEPVVKESESSAGSPIAWLILTSPDPAFDVQTLGDPIEDRIKPYLERIVGVSEVRVYGGRRREVHIEVAPRALAQRGITFNQFRDSLRLENVNISGGDLKEGRYDVRIRTVGQYENLDQVRDTILAYDPAGGPVRIRDIADVKLTYEKQRSFVRSMGQTGLALPVYRETGSNVMAVMEQLRERLKHINDEILPSIAAQHQRTYGLASIPPLQIRQAYDETTYIYDALALVRSNLFIGGSLAVLVLVVFLRSIRPTLVVALSIPISVIGTFVVMYGFGRNINVVSLAGLAFAVGMVVDSAIVVLENIDRHLGMGKNPRQAAADATREVWGAILASTLTTLAVFIPILTIQEEAGQLFRDITLAICAAVSLSLLVAVSVIPSASARWLRAHREPKTSLVKAGRRLFGLAPLLGGLVNRYAGFIHMLATPRWWGVATRGGIVAAFTVMAVVGAMLLMPPTDYLPRGNKNLVFGFVLTPPGLHVDTHLDLAHRAEAIVRPYWEASSYQDLQNAPKLVHPFSQQPLTDLPPLDNYFFVSFFGGVFNGAISGDKENVAPVADLLMAATNTSLSMGFAQQASLFQTGRSVGRGIEVEVMGLDLQSVLRSADALRGALIARFGPTNVQPTPANFDKAGRELQVKTDLVRASHLGVDVTELGAGIRALVDGLYVGDYRLGGESIDILAVRSPEMQLQADQIGDMPLAYRKDDGGIGIVPLSSIATFTREQAPQEIRRIDELRAVTLEVSPPDALPLEQVTLQIDQIVDQMRETGGITPDVEVRLAGSASKLQEVRAAMLGEWHGWSLQTLASLGLSRIFLALLVTYLLMAALFESWLYPFVIMFAVPLATVGGFIGLAIVHAFVPSQQLDTLTMLGFVILIGIVVNNAILIVHQALNFMRGLGDVEGTEGVVFSPRDAIRESVRSRVRPIFMTTLTSVCGMLPLVVMPGSGSELYRGLGSVVLGGLVCSTVFTLLVVPLLFSLTLDAKVFMAKRLGFSPVELEQAAAPQPRTSLPAAASS
jgi:HAE1 family hydrophobic/amphiphilic exporter-1